MNNWRICWFSRIFLLGILIFKGLTERRLYKSFGVKGLILCFKVFMALRQIARVLMVRGYKMLHTTGVK
jgi:hypothetical protein